MNPTQITYLTFGLLLLLALIFDLGILSKKNTAVSIRKALWQTLFWVSLSMGFCIFLWIEKSDLVATKYFAAYLMEWSLSVDNIFVFILIFTYFKVEPNDTARALLIGILLAIVLRIIFIAVGIQLIERFHAILYLFGAFLLYTGYKLFTKKDEAEYDPGKSKIYKFMQSFFRLSELEPKGRYFINLHGKTFITSLTVVVVMLAAVDIAFALDSYSNRCITGEGKSKFTIHLR
jgi:tellurite resistance protein TerC